MRAFFYRRLVNTIGSYSRTDSNAKRAHTPSSRNYMLYHEAVVLTVFVQHVRSILYEAVLVDDIGVSFGLTNLF